MKNVLINGVQLTEWEWILVEYGDVSDTNELRNLAALQGRLETAGFAKRQRLQRQIDALQESDGQTKQKPAGPDSD